MQKVNSPLTDEFNKVMPLWPKMARPIGRMFRFILYGKHKKKSSCPSEISRPRALILCL